LAGTIPYGLCLHCCSQLKLQAFVDAGWGSDLDDRKSTTGFVVFLGTNLISLHKKNKKLSHAVEI